jgi:lysophospholipase L1-like esterase
MISCPAGLSIRGASQPVTFALPTTTGGALPVEILCTPGSGTLFGTGTTVVACTATDALSRQAQCSFTITVSPFVLSVTKFVAFGDSLTEGENGRAPTLGTRVLDVPDAYPTKLQKLLNDEYPGQFIVVVNRGISGEGVETGAQRLPGVLSQEHPGALLLLDGYNNLLENCHVSAESTACAAAIDLVVAKLRDCIHIAQMPAYGVGYVFVSTLTPPGPYVSGSDRRIAPDAIVRTNARLSQMVRAEGAILVDPYPLFIGHESEYVDNDGLHLRPAGYEVLAETFFAAIRGAVAAMGRTR